MKKTIIYALITILLASFVCALPSFVIDDKSPGSDTVLTMNLIGTLRTEGIIPADYMAPALLNSEVNTNYLQGRTTVFIYHGKAAIIIGDAVLANKISNSLKSNFGIDTVTKLSSDIGDDDLTKIFEKRQTIQQTQDDKNDDEKPKDEPSKKDNETKPVCDGCLIDDACKQIGSRFSINDVPKYCSKSKQITIQKTLGSKCELAYECEVDKCIENICTTIPKQESPAEERGFFKKIWDWFTGIFS